MQPETPVPWGDIYELDIVQRARNWNQMRDVDTIAGINRRMRYGGYDGLVRDADKAYDDTIWKAAGAIVTKRDGVRLVIVAGPSSSGKTTTTLKLCEALRKMGQELQLLALDNYFWNLRDQPQDELGDRNFETPNALDKGLINSNLRDLIDGKDVVTPVYNFKTGKREAEGVPMKLSPGQLLVVEGLHGFHREMTAGIPHEQKFKIYIEAICQLKDGRGNFIPWTDIRLLRRMVRDNLHRNYTPLKTLEHWHYVRSAEKKHIVPFLNSTEVVVNGYLPYELPVHKKYLFQNLKEAVERLEKEDGREDAYRRACRCLGYLEEVDLLQDDSVIPATSLLREFIGGSGYA
jgi:uridine kinase